MVRVAHNYSIKREGLHSIVVKYADLNAKLILKSRMFFSFVFFLFLFKIELKKTKKNCVLEEHKIQFFVKLFFHGKLIMSQRFFV